MKEIFESYADNAFDEKTKEESINWKREWYEYNFKNFFPENLNASILDIGPGLGELLTVEKEWGYNNAMAIDISSSIANYCVKKGLKCICVPDSAEWLKGKREQFDIITVLDVLEHIPLDSVIHFLASCKEALKENGRLIIQVPNIQSPDSFLHRYNDLTHVFGYSQHTLEQVFTTSGFEYMKFYAFEEYPGDSADRIMVRKLRNIYWNIVRVNREITHNLNPEILTPEIFAVLTKNEDCLPKENMVQQTNAMVIEEEDLINYFRKIGLQSSLIDQINKIEWLQKAEDNHQEQLNNHQEQLDDHQKQLNERQRQLEEQQRQISEHQNQMNEFQLQFDEHQNQLNDHQEQMNRRQEQINDQQRQINDCQQYISICREEIENLKLYFQGIYN